MLCWAIGMGAAFEYRHPVLAASHDKGFESKFAHRALAEFVELAGICADLRLVRGFELGFIRRRGGDAYSVVLTQAIARIEHDALCFQRLHERRSGCAKAVIRDKHGVCLLCRPASFALDR